MSEIKKRKRHSPLSRGQSKPISSPIRERVAEAAFTLFREHGFSRRKGSEIELHHRDTEGTEV